MFKTDTAVIIPSTKVLRKFLREPQFRSIKTLKYYLQDLDNASKKMLNRIPLPPLVFTIEPISLSNLAMSVAMEAWHGFFPNCRCLYSAPAEDRTEYLLDITLSKGNESDQLHIVEIMTRKNRYETAQWYNLDTGIWEKDHYLDTLLNAQINNDPESDLIDALENGLGVPIVMCNPEAVCKELDRNQKLIDLAAKLNGKGRLKILDVQQGENEHDLRLTPVLTASDVCLFGTAVTLDDNGNYSLCSFNTDAEMREKAGLFYADPLKSINEICKPDESWLEELLKKAWEPVQDHKLHKITPDKNGEYVNECLDIAIEQGE